MPRRISNGTLGKQVLGNLVSIDNTFQSIITNEDIILQPDGLGIVRTTSHLRVQNGESLILADADNSASVSIQSPATLTASYSLTLPGNDGSVDQFLRTDGSGNLVWSNPFVNVTNNTSSTSTYYPALTTSTSGSIGEVTTSDIRLSFQPSTGKLTASVMQTSSLRDSSGRILVIKDSGGNILWGG